jgi:hypothetical protein
MLFLSVVVAPCVIVLAFNQVVAPATVKLGKTTIVGRDITPFKQEFFGGQCVHGVAKLRV